MLLLTSSQLLVTRPAPAQASVDAPPAAAFPNADASAMPPVDPPSAAPDSSAAPPPAPAVKADAPVESPAPSPPSGAPSPAVGPPSVGGASFAPVPESPAQHGPKRPVPAVPPKAATPRRAAPGAGPAQAGAQSTPDAPPGTPSAVLPESEPQDDSYGIFGPFRIGFLIGTGLPDLLSLGGTIKVTRYFGAGFNLGMIPTVKLSLYGDATISYHEYDLYGRVYPFGNAFFLGAGLGYAKIVGTLANRYALTPEESAASGLASPVQIDSRGSVRTLVLTPQLGLLKTFSSGFSIGVNVGAQIPIAPSTVDYATHVPPGVPEQLVTPNDDKVRSTLNTVGRTTLPTFDFKLGWLL